MKGTRKPLAIALTVPSTDLRSIMMAPIGEASDAREGRGTDERTRHLTEKTRFW